MSRDAPQKPQTPAQQREERLAKALRENLRRRKTAADGKPSGPSTGE